MEPTKGLRNQHKMDMATSTGWSVRGQPHVSHECLVVLLPFTVIHKYKSNLTLEKQSRDGESVGSCVDSHGDSEQVSGVRRLTLHAGGCPMNSIAG